MADGALPASQMARLLLLTPERLRQLSSAGHFPPAVKGQYGLVATVQGYVSYLKDEERRMSKSAAAADVHKARARSLEMRNAREEGRLMDADDVGFVIEATLTVFQRRLDGLPAACTRDLALRGVITTYLNQARDQMRVDFERGSEMCAEGRGDEFEATL